jgi:hypothetical protein
MNCLESLNMTVHEHVYRTVHGFALNEFKHGNSFGTVEHQVGVFELGWLTGDGGDTMRS